MKVIIKATDTIGEKKSVEFGANVNLERDVATQFTNIVRKKPNRTRIIQGLELYFGEAKLEMIADGKVIATGTITYNAFSGRGDVQTKRVA